MTTVGAGGGPTVLVAVDEDVLYGLIEYKLRKSGFSVARATDGMNALKQLTETQFDILLMDVMLQKLDGFTVLRELRTSGASPPQATIVLSARGDEQDVLTAFQLGALDYVTKPFSLGILVERIRIAFSAKSGQPLAENAMPAIFIPPTEPAFTAKWSIEA
jgi:DNA-binding response OmpR family regulator